MCDGKSIYFGMNKRCVATMLQSDTKYKFTVIAWTNEGRSESLPAFKKTAHINGINVKTSLYLTRFWIEDSRTSVTEHRNIHGNIHV